MVYSMLEIQTRKEALSVEKAIEMYVTLKIFEFILTGAVVLFTILVAIGLFITRRRR
jgi:hypothetical protein